MLPTLLTLSVALQAVAPGAPERRYRAEFERGVAALTDGRNEEAADAFRAAGTLAPQAPVWPLYLAAAEGREARPRQLPIDRGGPWRPVWEVVGWPLLTPSGDHLIQFGHVVRVFDVASGAQVCRVSSSQTVEGSTWWFPEASGRFLFSTQLGATYDPPLESIEVRRLATGEAACPPWQIGERFARGTALLWTAEPLAAGRHVEDGPWFSTRRIALDGGTLTAFLPKRNSVGDLNQTAVVRSDGARALVSYTEYRAGVRHATTELVAMDHAEPLATIVAEGDDTRFSRSGKLLLVGKWKGTVQVFEAESGTERVLPPDFQPEAGMEGELHRWSADETDRLLLVTGDRVRTWDPGSETWVADVTLEPALDDLPWLATDAPELIALGRARLLVFGCYAGVAVYDAGSGARLWSRQAPGNRFWETAWHAGPDDTLLVVMDRRGVPELVDARTGVRMVELAVGSTAAKSVTPFEFRAASAGSQVEGPEAHDGALVVAADGTLRTFALATGVDLGRAELHFDQHLVGVDVGALREPRRGPAAMTWDARGRVALWDLPGLEQRALLETELNSTVGSKSTNDERVWAGSVSSGIAVIARSTVDGTTPIELWRVAEGVQIGEHSIHSLDSVVFADDGLRVALVGSDVVLVLDALNGELRTRLKLATPEVGKYDAASTFHGPNQFVLGWGWPALQAGSGPGAGIDVYDLTTGARVGRHRARSFGIDASGGWVEDIESMPDLGRIAYSVSDHDEVFLLEDTDWGQVLKAAFGGSEQGVPPLARARGSERLFVSGMSGPTQRILDVKTLEFRALHKSAGLYQLSETDNGRYVVGIDQGRVSVLDGASLERLYERQELTGPGSRTLRDGQWAFDAGVGLSATEDVHLERGGASHPIASFGAWLNDPRGLARVSLAQLPEPPHIEWGPDRFVQTSEPTTSLRFRATDERGLLGAWIASAGRAPRFISIGDAASAADSSPDLNKVSAFDATFEGPWPLEVEVRAVGVTGLESKPWRVRIDGEE